MKGACTKPPWDDPKFANCRKAARTRKGWRRMCKRCTRDFLGRYDVRICPSCRKIMARDPNAPRHVAPVVPWRKDDNPNVLR